MSSFLDELIQRDYNPDGTMKLEYRENLRRRGWSETKIDALEQIHIRDAVADREDAQWRQELERQLAEWDALEDNMVGDPPDRPSTSIIHQSLSTINTHASQFLNEAKAGLEIEELLNQGFLEIDDLYHPSDDDEEMYSIPSEWKNIPDIEF